MILPSSVYAHLMQIHFFFLLHLLSMQFHKKEMQEKKLQQQKDISFLLTIYIIETVHSLGKNSILCRGEFTFWRERKKKKQKQRKKQAKKKELQSCRTVGFFCYYFVEKNDVYRKWKMGGLWLTMNLTRSIRNKQK